MFIFSSLHFPNHLPFFSWLYVEEKWKENNCRLSITPYNATHPHYSLHLIQRTLQNQSYDIFTYFMLMNECTTQKTPHRWRFMILILSIKSHKFCRKRPLCMHVYFTFFLSFFLISFNFYDMWNIENAFFFLALLIWTFISYL